MIKLSNITKVFHQGTRTIQALNNVSLHVPAGQIYGVIGASGAGKSTLIRCVNLLERPTEGSVLVDGQELTTLSESELTKARRQIGMISSILTCSLRVLFWQRGSAAGAGQHTERRDQTSRDGIAVIGWSWR